MPYSFTQIEEDKTKTIRFVFFFLILVYFAVFWLIAVIALNALDYEANPYVFRFRFAVLDLPHILIILGLAFMIGYAHWGFTTAGLVTRILGVLKAEALNPKDTYHQMFRNIVEEVSVATGGRKMEPVIVPTMAMNAFAVTDFSGRAVIGLTEGVLARLTRAQIEAVVGHEAAHIVTGDSLATTITTSLFELFSGVLRGFEAIFRFGGGGRNRSSVRAQGRGGGGVIVFLLLIYFLLAFTKFLSYLMRMFISRQREYRADAIATRLTRDPLSLAEALYAISYRWRGVGLPAQELESIFIINPAYSSIDEQNGFLPDLFSTHPPVHQRMGILLNMAHSDLKTVIKNIDHQAQRPRSSAPDIGTVSLQWMVNKDGAWQGPFNMAQLTVLGGIGPETWIQRIGGGNVQLLYQDPEARDAVIKNDLGAKNSSYHCPRCAVPLRILTYEGTEVFKCPSCRGTLVGENDIKRIIIREEIGFSDRIEKIAQGIQREETSGLVNVIKRDPKTLLKCPKCRFINNRMMRMFYTEVYRIEIDRCFNCGLIWFDADELEVLQCMIESALSKSK